MTLYEKAIKTTLASRFIARADDLNRPLTDEETKAELKYQLEDLPFKGLEKTEEKQATKELKALLKSK